MKELSIVIPVYKVEQYIRKCLDSCLNQNVNHERYEIIAVNDGSPDNCEKILNIYQKKYKNIIVISQKNQGLSVARNTGLREAKGEYIWFIDSDDSIVENCLNDILKALSDRPDILNINYQKVFEDKRTPILVESKFINTGILAGREVLIKGGLDTPAQFGIYNRRFLNFNNIEFYPGIYHEDVEFKPRVTYLARRISFHSPIVYNYLQRTNGSITSSFKLKNAMDILLVERRLHDFYISHVMENRCKTAFQRIIGMNLNTILDNLNALNGTDIIKFKNQLAGSQFIFNDMIRSVKIKYVIEAMLFKINSKLALSLYNLIK